MGKVLIACGGTGGHFLPGLAVAEALQRRGVEVTLLLCGKDVEQVLSQQPGVLAVTVPMRPFVGGVAGQLRTFWVNARALWRLLKLVGNVDVVLGMGGYGAAVPLLAALLRRRRIALHEANAVPGRVTEMFASRAEFISLGFPECQPYLVRRVRQSEKLVVTGVPIRSELVRAARQRRSGLADPARVLIVGGSRGSAAVNRIATRALARLWQRGLRFSVDHICGFGKVSEVTAAYEQEEIPAQVLEFTADVTELYSRADVAVARSGASTCAELALFGIPAIFIPYPYAVRDHQWKNAAALAEAGGAVVCSEEKADPETIAESLEAILTDTERRQRMAEAIQKRAQPEAAEKVAELVVRLLSDQTERKQSAAL